MEPPSPAENASTRIAIGQMPELTKGHARYDLNERRKNTLAEIDKARFSCASILNRSNPVRVVFDNGVRAHCRWFHVRVCLVAGAGFFTDAYVSTLDPFLSLIV